MAIGPCLLQLIVARKALALSEGDMDLYRTLHAATLWLLDGCERAMLEEGAAFGGWVGWFGSCVGGGARLCAPVILCSCVRGWVRIGDPVIL